MEHGQETEGRTNTFTPWNETHINVEVCNVWTNSLIRTLTNRSVITKAISSSRSLTWFEKVKMSKGKLKKYISLFFKLFFASYAPVPHKCSDENQIRATLKPATRLQ